MLLSTILEREFIHKEGNREISLADPGRDMSPDAVMNFYSPTYPVLTNARVVGPEIKRDKIVFRFESVMGTKG